MKLKTIYIFMLLLFFIRVATYGQQTPLYTQYYNNLSIINPAYAGSHDYFTTTLNVRSQWLGEPDGPRTQALSTHGNTGKSVGLGLSIVHDKVYVLSETHIYGDFSYTLDLTETSKLALGLKAGGSYINVDLMSLDIGNDPLFNENINVFNPNFGIGAFYYNDKCFVSLSSLNLLKKLHYEKSSNVVASAANEILMYLSAGYVFDLGDSFKLKPSFMLRAAKGSPLSTDISTSVLWNNKFELGISHRLNESFAGVFQFVVNDTIKIGYSYDVITNDAITEHIGNYGDSSHELSVIFDINKVIGNKLKLRSPFYWR